MSMQRFQSRKYRGSTTDRGSAIGVAAVLLLVLHFPSEAGYGQVVPPEQDPRAIVPPAPSIRIGGPVFLPPSIPPSNSLTDVTVGATAAGAENLPTVLFLEEVTGDGEVLDTVAELKDDGKGADPLAGDGKYTAAVLQFGEDSESDRFFRIRVDEGRTQLFTRAVTFAVTDLPIGFPTSDPAKSVLTPDKLDRAFTNQAVFTTEQGVAPRRVRQLVAEVATELGENVEISGYVPGLDGYMVRFDGEATYEAIARVVQLLERRAEIVSATPTFVGRPSADWWLETTEAMTLRKNSTHPTGTAYPPVFGSSDIGVAIIELGASAGVKCTMGGLTCMPAASISSITQCSGMYASITTTNAHGTKVANLLAGDPPSSPPYDQGGIAPDVRLLPLRASSGPNVAEVLNCVVAYDSAPGTDGIHVVNMSLESNLTATAEATLKNAICNAACSNILMVAAAGNRACSPPPPLPFPGRFGDSTETCSCGSSPTVGDFMLRVGGTTVTDALGETSCDPPDDPDPDYKSHFGDIYAPGWGIPGPPANFGTSWATPLVAGCAAVRGAVDIWQDGAAAWDARDVESRLRSTANSVAGLSGGGILNCHAAVQDPYDIVFLLDQSGSMSLPAGASGSRWTALANAAGGFAQLLAVSAPAMSKFGLTLFSSSLSEPMGSGLSNIGAALPATVNSHLTITPGGSTGLGLGLKNAVAKLSAVNRPRIVVLFTDGEQNIPPPSVNLNGCAYSDGTPVDTGCPASRNKGSVKIVPIGIGSPSTVYLNTLQALADEHRGTLLITDGTGFNPNPFNSCSGSLDAAFDCAVAPALYGNSLQMVASTHAELLPGTELLKFSVNQGITRLIVKLSAPASSSLDFRRLQDRLRVTRNGDDVSRYFTKSIGVSPTSVLLHTDFRAPTATSAMPRLPPDGNYAVSLLPVIGGDPATLPIGDVVRIVAFADDHRLDMSWKLSPPMPRVGTPVTVRVAIRWAGQPVPGADVSARIFKPGDDLGHVLALHPKRIDPRSGVDAPSPGRQKYDHLWRTDEEFRNLLAPNEQVLQLTDNGDGTYEGSFDPGDISGIYQVSYQVRVEDIGFGTIEREAAQSAYVRFGEFELDKSIVSRSVKGNTITLMLKPIATTGRFIGPGNGSIFSVAGASARIDKVTDHQDGSYTLVLTADPKSDIEFNVLGQTVYEGRADFADRNSKHYWWIVLLLLILAASA